MYHVNVNGIRYVCIGLVYRGDVVENESIRFLNIVARDFLTHHYEP